LQHAMQFQRIRRGIQSFCQRARVAAAQRADDPGLDLLLLEQRSNPLAARCLAIRAGYAAYPQRLRRSAVKLVRDGARAELEAGQGEVRYPPLAAPGAPGFPQLRRGHYVFSFASSPSAGVSSGSSGASCGTPIMRSAPCVTCANTGAATMPP